MRMVEIASLLIISFWRVVLPVQDTRKGYPYNDMVQLRRAVIVGTSLAGVLLVNVL